MRVPVVPAGARSSIRVVRATKYAVWTTSAVVPRARYDRGMPEPTPSPPAPTGIESEAGMGESRIPAPWSLGWRVWRWNRADLVAGAVLVVLAVVAYGPSAAVVPAVVAGLATPVLWRVDVAERRLPNTLVLPIGYVAFGAVVSTGLAGGTVPIAPVAAAAGAFLFFLVLNLAGGMGMGDVKLAAVLTAALALESVGSVVVAALVAFFAGGVAGLAVHLRSGGRTIAFGPFLLTGYWVAVVVSAHSAAAILSP